LDAAVITPFPTPRKSVITELLYAAFREASRKAGLGPELSRYSNLTPTMRDACNRIQGVSHASIVTGWDNTPRSGRRGLVLTGYNEQSLRRAARDAATLEMKNKQPLLFIKSWNEWAEGNMLEPIYKENWSAGDVIKQVLRACREGSATRGTIQEALNVG
jgi:hypothetical protein